MTSTRCPEWTVLVAWSAVQAETGTAAACSNVRLAGLGTTLVALTLTYPASTGRNFDELLRVIDSLQLTAKYKVATPANWQDGEDCIIVTGVKDEEIPANFPKGHRRVKPYLRYTPQPNK